MTLACTFAARGCGSFGWPAGCMPGQGSGNRGADRAHDLAARWWPVAAAMHHPAITTRAITSQIISLTYQMMSLIRAEIRNPTVPPRMCGLWWGRPAVRPGSLHRQTFLTGTRSGGGRHLSGFCCFAWPAIPPVWPGDQIRRGPAGPARASDYCHRRGHLVPGPTTCALFDSSLLGGPERAVRSGIEPVSSPYLCALPIARPAMLWRSR